MKKSVTIAVDSDKLAALEMYLKQKNISLTDELDKCVEGMYQKYVPSNVREFIEMTASKKPPKREKTAAPITFVDTSEE